MNAETRAIALILAGTLSLSVNDTLIKFLSDDYPLHQIVFVRSAIGVVAGFAFLRMEGGVSLLRTDRPALHALRAVLIVVANMTFFAALAVMPLGAATALFFVAPLFITLLAVPVLGERIGAPRMAAIVVGLVGVGVMMAPGADWGGIPRWNLLLPIAAAACYSGMQVLTRKLGGQSAASAMAIYIQGMFIVVSVGFYLVTGDGRLAEDGQSAALQFLFRAWVWPAMGDLWIFAVLGVMSSLTGYALSQAYRLGTAAVVASYEYVALPLALLWGWVVFGEVPDPIVWVGIALIAGAGLAVFARERALGRPVAAARPLRRS